MTLKIIITPLHLLLNVVFHVDNKVEIENMHIRDPNFASNYMLKVCHYFGVARGRKFKANGD